ncbi:MAG: C40 family peptidase [Ramlibacter sp.]
MSTVFCLATGVTALASGAPDHSAQAVAVYAQTLVGRPYRAGGSTPEQGFDCSGFVQHVFLASAHVDLPRRARDMAGRGKRVAARQLRPGDLVFFNTLGTPYSHVGIYVGDGQFAHAPSSGGRVRIVAMNQRYWSTRFSGARRLLGRAATASPAKPGPRA